MIESIILTIYIYFRLLLLLVTVGVFGWFGPQRLRVLLPQGLVVPFLGADHPFLFFFGGGGPPGGPVATIRGLGIGTI